MTKRFVDVTPLQNEAEAAMYFMLAEKPMIISEADKKLVLDLLGGMEGLMEGRLLQLSQAPDKKKVRITVIDN